MFCHSIQDMFLSNLKSNTYIIVLVVNIVFWESFIFFCVLYVLLLTCHGPRGCFAHYFDFIWVSTAHLSPGKIKHHISVALEMIIAKGIKIWGCVVVVIKSFCITSGFCITQFVIVYGSRNQKTLLITDDHLLILVAVILHNFFHGLKGGIEVG